MGAVYRAKNAAVRSVCGCLLALSAAAAPPNFLVIAIDDLRPELGTYGAKHMHTPHIDALAERGVVFERAYAQYALCGPSRNSIFTGARPDTTRVHRNSSHFRGALPGILSMPELFKKNGYQTRGLGKILHNNQEDPQSWSEPFFFITAKQYASKRYRKRQVGIDGIHDFNRELPLWEGPDVPDDAYRDGVIRREAVKTLRRFARDERPFFLMAGFHKPHTPFVAPKKYWELYDRASLPLAPNPFAPRGAPPYALSAWRYVRSFKGIPHEGPLDEPLARVVRHAYFAAVSYIDTQVGMLIAELERLGRADDTVVVLWSDHGYQLGDHGMWSKHTNYETSTRVPLVVSDPRNGVKAGRSHARVELVDLYPTVAELAGFAVPGHVEGESLVPLLRDPHALDGEDTVAYSQFSRAGKKGVSVRSERYRYVEWRDTTSGVVHTTELYDHQSDPFENHNIAEGADTVALQARLAEVWPR